MSFGVSFCVHSHINTQPLECLKKAPEACVVDCLRLRCHFSTVRIRSIAVRRPRLSLTVA